MADASFFSSEPTPAMLLLAEAGRRHIAVGVRDGRLAVSGDQQDCEPELIERLRQHRDALIESITRGESLINELWERGFSIRFVRSKEGAISIIPTGNGRMDEGLFKRFDENHDCAVAVFLSRLPWRNAEPDIEWWNAVAAGRLETTA